MVPPLAHHLGGDLGDVFQVHMGQARSERVGLAQDSLCDHVCHVDVLHVVHGLKNSERHSGQQHHAFHRQLCLVVQERLKLGAVSYTHLRAHETRHDLVCRLLLEKKKIKLKITAFMKLTPEKITRTDKVPTVQ